MGINPPNKLMLWSKRNKNQRSKIGFCFLFFLKNWNMENLEEHFTFQCEETILFKAEQNTPLRDCRLLAMSMGVLEGMFR